jgi:predicted phosphodiesterase
MKETYTKEDLVKILDKLVDEIGQFPTRRELRASGVSENPFFRIFGNLTNAKEWYVKNTKENKPFLEEDDEPRVSTVKDGLIETLKKNLTEDELKALVQSTSVQVHKPLAKKVIFSETGHFKFIATGDSHIGHNKFREDWWNFMVERGIEEKVDFMYHTGDILEGMSGRPGHIYELDQIGFEAQFAKAKALIQDIPFEVRFVTGNHDNWYAGKADQGINVGKRLEESLDNVVFLGDGEADDIVNGIKVKLWHGNDGASYALSYRTQKFVEMLTGGEKPHILLAGHAHKSVFYENRNVHVFETGTTCGQSNFMRGKKLAAHTGFWIVDVWTNAKGISRIRPEWYPFYV